MKLKVTKSQVAETIHKILLYNKHSITVLPVE